jgi:2-polyprenyl-3-methyl-5-hydroxy-6-metoxy-1,4-benzoquinol methylase
MGNIRGRIQTLEIKRLANKGERVVHTYRNDCYFAHLSIYRFALDHCRGKRVLDAGCGTGYGSDYLRENGAASVLAIDSSQEAIRYCRRHFQTPGLQFRRMGVSDIGELAPQRFDLVFCSNTLEHVPDVASFFHAANRLLEPDGLLILAVPAIVDEESRTYDSSNPYHLNIWSPHQWRHVLGGYFANVESYRHALSAANVRLDFGNSPEQCRITEKDFEFPACEIEQMKEEGTLTAIFLARTPKPSGETPPPEAPVEFVDDSFSRPAPSSNLLSRLIRALGAIISGVRPC